MDNVWVNDKTIGNCLANMTPSSDTKFQFGVGFYPFFILLRRMKNGGCRYRSEYVCVKLYYTLSGRSIYNQVL